MCRQGIAMVLGKEPIVEEVRGADGVVTRTTKLLDAEPAKAGRLGEAACANARWQGCMYYAMLLARGDGLPHDRVRAEALTQYACSKGHALACESLQSNGIPPVQNPTLPPAPSWVDAPPLEQSASAPAHDTTVATLQQLRKERESGRAVAPGEADLIARCLGGTRDACYRLGQGYEKGVGMTRDATRSAFYYEKACGIGHEAACAHLEKSAVTASTSSVWARFGVPAITICGLLVVALIASRRRASAQARARPRPAPVRPAVPRR
jgi:TPR repeat protein